MRFGPALALLTAGAPIAVLAAPDPGYNPQFPFRPQNITALENLTGLYGLVGSYYNGTTQIDLMPEIGYTYQNQVCEGVRGKNYTRSITTSILAVTPKNIDNENGIPVDAFLSMWNPGTNFSSLQLIGYDWLFQHPIAWHLETAPWPTYSSNTSFGAGDGSYWLGTKAVESYFNMTQSPASKAPPYNLSRPLLGDGQTELGDAVQSISLDLDRCDVGPFRSDSYNVSFQTDPLWWSVQGWKGYVLPSAGVQFDGKTANFTMEGSFFALVDQFSTAIFQGQMRVSFFGVIDPYHSDVLVSDSATPTWLKTVGFSNNSMNVGYDESGAAGAPSYAFAGCVVIMSMLMAMYM